MTPLRLHARGRLAVLAFFALSLGLPLPLPTQAAPGAHGPNGEHLDGPAAGQAAAGTTAPRFEAASEAFEMVGRYQAGALALFINRYETSEPVLNAAVELESSGVKADAAFRAEQGDYLVFDERFLQTIARPGQHGIVVMLTAGAEADLLDGMLTVGQAADDPAHDHDHGHPHLSRRAVAAAGAAGLLALGGVIWIMRRRRRSSAGLQGAAR